jgi:FKBP-type peptidyl-prolyl cis-trans isomerase (trigger factor)
MKIRSNTREGNKVILEVEEEYSKLKDSIEATIVEAGKEVKIPGFRPGKAPKELIRKALNKEAVEAEAVQRLISSLYPVVLDEAKIEPVDYPNIQILEHKKNKPIVFKVEVDVYPEVKLGKYKGLKVEKKEVKVTDEDLDKVLENFRKRLQSLEKLSELPALDDEFAKKVSRYQTFEELKKELRESMQRDKEGQEDAEVRNKLIAEASADAKMDIPNGMLEREIDIMLDELKNSIAPMNLSLEDYLKGINKDEKTMREELRKSAKVRVMGKVVLKAVAGAEKLNISDEEMNEELKALASAGGQSPQDLSNLDEHARKYIEDYLLRRKALDFMAEKAKVKEVKGEK